MMHKTRVHTNRTFEDLGSGIIQNLKLRPEVQVDEIHLGNFVRVPGTNLDGGRVIAFSEDGRHARILWPNGHAGMWFVRDLKLDQ